MSEFLTSHEGAVRLSVFLAMLAGMAAWELAAPRRRAEIPRLIRWSNNFVLVALDSALVRLCFPILAVGFAALSAERGWGVMNMLDAPGWLAIPMAVIALDLAIYGQHVLFHKVPLLWRLHRVHHADLEFDVSTGVRFHPVEILLSMALKLAVVAILGAPAIAVLLFEVILSATSLFNHSNIHLPKGIDALLRLVIVTPDMHRVHHSIDRVETDSNYGFNIPWWDRIFGTYRAQPKDGHTGMTIGIEMFRTRRDLWLDRMLVQPLRGPASAPDPNKRG